MTYLFSPPFSRYDYLWSSGEWDDWAPHQYERGIYRAKTDFKTGKYYQYEALVLFPLKCPRCQFCGAPHYKYKHIFYCDECFEWQDESLRH